MLPFFEHTNFFLRILSHENVVCNRMRKPVMIMEKRLGTVDAIDELQRSCVVVERSRVVML